MVKNPVHIACKIPNYALLVRLFSPQMHKSYLLVAFFERLVALFGKKFCIYEKKAVPLQPILSGSVHRCGKFFVSFTKI